MDALECLDELKADADTSKRLKERAESIISILKGNEAMCVEKALLQLEEMNSVDLSSYHRTKVWDIISILESAK